MSDIDFTSKEIYACFGLAIYKAQVIEKGIMNLILGNKSEQGINKTRYDEILFELSELTFGQLKRKLNEVEDLSDEICTLLDEFHMMRDSLVHSYWWDRVVELQDESKHEFLLKELRSYIDFFEFLNSLITDQLMNMTAQHGIDYNSMIDEITNEMVSQGSTPKIETFRKLKNNEIIVDFFGLKMPSNGSMPIFELQDCTLWTIGEIGLTQFKHEVDKEYRIEYNEIKKLLPIKMFRPRPKNSDVWDYELDLKKNGFKLIVKRDKEHRIIWELKQINK